MTDEALENAAAQRDAMAKKIAIAEEQIKEWRKKMQRAERFIADWEEFSGQQAPRPEAQPFENSQKPKRKPKNPKKEEVAEVAQKILLAHGKPMTRDELFEALPENGIIIHGKNPPVVLQTMLWRMQDVIVHLKGFGYWPSDTAWPEADYDPERDPQEEVENEPESSIF